MLHSPEVDEWLNTKLLETVITITTDDRLFVRYFHNTNSVLRFWEDSFFPIAQSLNIYSQELNN